MKRKRDGWDYVVMLAPAVYGILIGILISMVMDYESGKVPWEMKLIHRVNGTQDSNVYCGVVK